MRDALKDTDRVGKIYVGLTHFIITNIMVQKISPNYYNTIVYNPLCYVPFPSLEHICQNTPWKWILKFLHTNHNTRNNMDEANNHSLLEPAPSLKLLNKLLLNKITHIFQITLPNGFQFMSKYDFQHFYTTSIKPIISRLNIAK